VFGRSRTSQNSEQHFAVGQLSSIGKSYIDLNQRRRNNGLDQRAQPARERAKPLLVDENTSEEHLFKFRSVEAFRHGKCVDKASSSDHRNLSTWADRLLGDDNGRCIDLRQIAEEK
jgi:hypothetical protein